MGTGIGVGVSRRSARAILLDEQGRLVLIKRVKPGLDPYWTTPGGGMEAHDASLEAAMRRELAEELGAEVGPALPVFLASTMDGAGVAIQYFFLTRLLAADEGARTGSEFGDPARGEYVLDRIDLVDGLAGLDLRPRELRDFVLANRTALLLELARMER